MRSRLLSLRQVYLSGRRHLSRSCGCQSKVPTSQSDNSTDSSSGTQPYFITTPIFYVNAAPHIGHLYTALLADVAARWQRLKGRKVTFATGTDEHGLKIQQAASMHNASPQDYCDKVSAQFKTLFDQCGVAYNEFIRTTDPRHEEAVCTFWETLSKQGHIYKGSYEGWYSVSDEAFLTEEEVEDGVAANGQMAKVSISSGQPVVWTKEDNYMFRLTEFRPQLTSWLNSGVVKPELFEPVVRGWLDDLRDLSVSRQRQRLAWGIAVPGDSSQTIYVWLDALVNYLTVAGYPHNHHISNWPPNCQIIGKDILRFHAIYWPAFLLAADMTPPSCLLCHSHWLVDGHKMSKSRGNVIDPFDRLQKLTVDGLRYFLLKEGSIGSDGNYSDERAVQRINSELVNTIGNLLSRISAPSINKLQEFPPLEAEISLHEFLTEEDIKMYMALPTLGDQVEELYENFAYPGVLDLLLRHLYWANATVQSHQPWVLVKVSDPGSQQHLTLVLHIAMETLRVCGILLQPMVPQLSDRLLTRLGIAVDRRGLSDVRDYPRDSRGSLGENVTLLRRIQAGKP